MTYSLFDSAIPATTLVLLAAASVPSAQEPVRFYGAQVPSSADPILTDVSIDFDSNGLQDAFGVLESTGLADSVVALFNMGAAGFIDGPGAISLIAPPLAGAAVSLDVNGDGLIEQVIMTSSASRDVYVIAADSAGNLTLLDQILPSSGAASHLSAGDLDADGDSDLVINAQDANFDVWLNDGLGNFVLDASYGLPLGSVSQALPLLDLDGDGFPELVAPAGLGSIVYVIPATGAGQYGTPFGIPLAYSPGDQSLVGDFDGDGFDDLLLSGNLATDTAAVLFSDGAGSLIEGPLQAIPSGSFRGRDRDGTLGQDGDLDILVTAIQQSQRPARMHLFENDGNGLFSADLTGVFDLNDPVMAMRDMDGDGIEDLMHAQPDLVSSATGFLIAIRLGLSDGSFELHRFIDIVDSSEVWKLSEVVDIDRDGIREVVGGTSEGEVVILRNLLPNDDSTVDRILIDPNASINEVRFADFNGDCVLDMAVRDTDATVYVYTGAADGSYSLTFQRTFESPILSGLPWLRVDDVNGDGVNDLLTEARLNTIRGFAVLLGDGASDFGPTTHYATGLNSSVGMTILSDFGGDSLPDLFFGGSFNDAATLFINDGAGVFQPSVDPAAFASQAVDIDLDGDQDLAYLEKALFSTETELVLYENVGNSSFVEHRPTLSEHPWQVGFGDLDGDAVPDLYVESDSEAIFGVQERQALYLGNGDFTFAETAPRYASTTSLYSGGYRTADLDQDGSGELIMTTSAGVSIRWNLSPDEDDVCQPDLGFDGPGDAVLSSCGDRLELGGQTTPKVIGAAPNRNVFFLASSNFAPTCLLGLDVVTNPVDILLVAPADGSGKASLPPVTSIGVPFSYWVQAAFFDSSLPAGVGLTNAIRLDFLN